MTASIHKFPAADARRKRRSSSVRRVELGALPMLGAMSGACWLASVSLMVCWWQLAFPALAGACVRRGASSRPR